MKKSYRSLLLNLIVATGSLSVGTLAPVQARTLIHDVIAASESNVIFSDAGGGFVDISFTGDFDFSSIGGALESYSGVFRYDTSVPPVFAPPNPDIDIAHYELEVLSFNIFGNLQTASHAGVLVQDGEGVFSDFFTFQVTLDVFNGPGVPIPSTTAGLVSIGINAGAWPPTMFSSADLPVNLDIFVAATAAPTQFAELSLDDSPLLITQIQYEPDGTVRIRADVPVGPELTLEESSDLITWRVLDVLSSETATIEFIDRPPVGTGTRFYRISVQR